MTSLPDFMPHGYCYQWDPYVLWLHVLSDSFIALSYYCIPATLAYFVRRRRDLPFNWVYLMFGAFILGCGTTHGMEVWTIWRPSYYVSGLIKAITAGLSVSTTILLIPLFPKLLVLPSPSQLRRMNEALEREVNERKRAEARFRGLLETAPDAVVVVNSKGEIVLANLEAEKMFGYQKSEILGQSLSMLIPARSRENHRKYQAEFFSEPKVRSMRSGPEFFGLHKEGREFPIEVSLSPLETDEGILVTSAIRDITERKHAQDKIQKLNQELVLRNIELVSANKELESFSYSVSHDLRTPLRAIDGFSQAILEDYVNCLDATGKTYFQNIREASSRMDQLINGLLSLAKTSRTEILPEKVDLSVLAQGILSQFKSSEPRREVTFTIAPGLVAEGDRVLLRSALENLLGNAWKFTSKRSDAHIEFGVTHLGDEEIYFVRDDGAGFEMQYVNKVFELFQRLHDKNDFPGTGVGLAIVARIIQRHGGRIWAEGAVGNGATFYFVLGKGEFTQKAQEIGSSQDNSGL